MQAGAKTEKSLGEAEELPPGRRGNRQRTFPPAGLEAEAERAARQAATEGLHARSLELERGLAGAQGRAQAAEAALAREAERRAALESREMEATARHQARAAELETRLKASDRNLAAREEKLQAQAAEAAQRAHGRITELERSLAAAEERGRGADAALARETERRERLERRLEELASQGQARLAELETRLKTAERNLAEREERLQSIGAEASQKARSKELELEKALVQAQERSQTAAASSPGRASAASGWSAAWRKRSRGPRPSRGAGSLPLDRGGIWRRGTRISGAPGKTGGGLQARHQAALGEISDRLQEAEAAGAAREEEVRAKASSQAQDAAGRIMDLEAALAASEERAQAGGISLARETERRLKLERQLKEEQASHDARLAALEEKFKAAAAEAENASRRAQERLFGPESSMAKADERIRDLENRFAREQEARAIVETRAQEAEKRRAQVQAEVEDALRRKEAEVQERERVLQARAAQAAQEHQAKIVQLEQSLGDTEERLLAAQSELAREQEGRLALERREAEIEAQYDARLNELQASHQHKEDALTKKEKDLEDWAHDKAQEHHLRVLDLEKRLAEAEEAANTAAEALSRESEIRKILESRDEELETRARALGEDYRKKLAHLESLQAEIENSNAALLDQLASQRRKSQEQFPRILEIERSAEESSARAQRAELEKAREAAHRQELESRLREVDAVHSRRIAELQEDLNRERESLAERDRALAERARKIEAERSRSQAELSSLKEALDAEHRLLLEELTDLRTKAEGHHPRVMELERRLVSTQENARRAAEALALEAERRKAIELREAALEGFSTATDLADYLVRKGVAFRDAHGAVARAVREAELAGCGLPGLPLAVLKRFSNAIEKDVFQVLTLEGSVAARDHPGGTAPRAVRAAAARGRRLPARKGERE